MSRRAVGVVACLGFALFAASAHAAPISSCTSQNGNYVCDLFESDANGDPATHASVFPADSGLDVPGWLTGYTFLLEAGATYDGTDTSVISDVLFIHNDSVELFSALDSGFAGAIANALAAAALLSDIGITSQIVGDPGLGLGGGALAFGNIGLVHEDVNGVALLQDLFFLGGDGDTVTIHSDVGNVEPPPTGVPEPGTLALLACGLVAAAFGRRVRA